MAAAHSSVDLMHPSRRHVLGLMAATAALPAGTAAASTPPRGGTVLIRDVRIFDGHRVLGRGSVLVVGGRIAAAGRLPQTTKHPVYDGGGRTLLPGLIDCHVHTFEGSSADALRFGVTTELEMFGDPALLAEARRRRRSLARTDQADLWSAGNGVTVPGGHPHAPEWEFPQPHRHATSAFTTAAASQPGAGRTSYSSTATRPPTSPTCGRSRPSGRTATRSTGHRRPRSDSTQSADRRPDTH